jgi:hypothetical protein
MGKRFFNILATFAEFEVDLLRMRAREGMAIARQEVRRRRSLSDPISDSSGADRSLERSRCATANLAALEVVAEVAVILGELARHHPLDDRRDEPGWAAELTLGHEYNPCLRTVGL